MKSTAEYRIIYQGLFQEQDFEIDVVSNKRKYLPSTSKIINVAWQEARLNPAIQIFNGKVFSLNRISIGIDKITSRNKLHLKLQATDYKSFYGTNVCSSHILPKSELANALAVCAVVETIEGTVFVGKRSHGLAETSGYWHVPGGTFNQAVNPLAIMNKELKEELNIAQKDIQTSVCLGFGENLSMRKPEFLCYYHLNLTTTQLDARIKDAKDKDEHTEYVFVPMEELQSFVDMHDFAPIGKAAVALYLDFILRQRNIYA